ncbi:unnamed protein product [Heligmosomoides polygyrus]|uniref:Reverse transcriptase domain-containing protein n=1 Tax=Heligmosomoides polygyrus TaxID=6339 RepID=A0A3P8B2G3_HELPZ|nr:unnamed protein product [Heligmosomoides polygyrus]
MRPRDKARHPCVQDTSAPHSMNWSIRSQFPGEFPKFAMLNINLVIGIVTWGGVRPHIKGRWKSFMHVMIHCLLLLALACSVLATADAQSPTFDRQDRDYRPLQILELHLLSGTFYISNIVGGEHSSGLPFVVGKEMKLGRTRSIVRKQSTGLADVRPKSNVPIVVKTVKSAGGRVLGKPVEVRERWEEYFKELLKEEFPRREAEEEQPTEGPIPPWTQKEVRKAIGKMKLGKAAGPDGVPVEAWKVLGDLGINRLTQFLNRITKEGKISDDWRNSTIVPIFKQKGDASECSNYRGIKLISHTMKIYERLVDSRLREMVPISQVQWGFMPERSATVAIFIARQVMEKYREKRKPWHSWTWRRPMTG